MLLLERTVESNSNPVPSVAYSADPKLRVERVQILMIRFNALD